MLDLLEGGIVPRGIANFAVMLEDDPEVIFVFSG